MENPSLFRMDPVSNDINIALQESLTYQPSVPSGNMKIQALKVSYEYVKGNVSGEFFD